ncbi:MULTISPECIES: hypothetical protein [Streptomyces violaceusniger group]|uniref:MarR family transcriptional regulator n=2 Tax=Streptomyces rhizosphaericus TaxID=114699 RepID=A0ABN1R1P6_9ACTN|nr:MULTISPECIES: hypothetical protein [Streptomyces violaceusniger group]
MPRLSLTTERLALFGTLLATFGELHRSGTTTTPANQSSGH